MRPFFVLLFECFWLVGVLCAGFSRHLWTGRARHPGPSPLRIAVEVFKVGGWLPHGDSAVEEDVDFFAVVEHRLIPARVRSEYAGLEAKGISSAWAPASQESPHAGNAGARVVNLKGAPFTLPTIAWW